METKYLYGFTIQGIQRYIFSSNKLTEIIGASEIIEELTSTKTINNLLGLEFNEKYLFRAAAGNLIYLCKTENQAMVLYEKFPEIIKGTAGNITLNQAIVKVVGEMKFNHLTELERKFRTNRNKPIIEPDTALMARTINRRTGEPTFIENERTGEFYDYTTNQKAKHKDAKSIIDKICTDDGSSWIYPKKLTEITNEQNKHFIAIVHADGNKLGTTIQEILNKENASKTGILKRLSQTIEESTKSAFKRAFNKVIIKQQNLTAGKDQDGAEANIAPLRPVILGGDDVTFIIRADLAVEFTNVFLKEFEDETNKNFQSIGLKSGLTATAGITFIKEKFPFHYGIHLADSITSYAKNKTNREKSSLLFYKVQDSFVNDYNDIVKIELSPNGFDFENGPYDFNGAKNLLEKVKLMNIDRVSSGPFRRILTLIYKNTVEADFAWERIKEIQPKAIKEIGFRPELKDNKILYDLITLHSLTTDY